MSETKQNVFKFKIDEKVTAGLEDAGAMAAAMQTSLTQFIDAHALDPDASAVTSPVCGAFRKQAADAQKQFDRLKREMELKYFDPNKDQPFVQRWSLDYATSVVTVTMTPGRTLTGIGVEVFTD